MSNTDLSSSEEKYSFLSLNSWWDKVQTWTVSGRRGQNVEITRQVLLENSINPAVLGYVFTRTYSYIKYVSILSQKLNRFESSSTP